MDKADDLIGAWKRLFAYMSKYRPYFVIALVFATVGTALSLLGPNLISEITDLIEEGLYTGIDLAAVSSIGIVLVAVYAISWVLTFLQNYLMATVSQRTAYNLR